MNLIGPTKKLTRALKKDELNRILWNWNSNCWNGWIFFRYVTVCFGTWNLTLLCDSWYVIRAASLILNVAFSRKWPLPDHPHFDFLDMKETLNQTSILGVPNLLGRFFEEWTGSHLGCPQLSTRSVEDVCCPSGDKPTDELRVRCPGVFFFVVC